MWQPIETAPKDQFLLLCGPSGYTTTPMVVTTGRMCSDYHAGRWIDHANDDLTDWGFRPTHWAPLVLPGAQPAESIKDDIIDDLQSQFDTEGITEHDSGDALIRLYDAIAAVEDNFALAQPAPSVPEGFALVNATHFLAVLDREDWRTAKNRAELRAMLAAEPAQSVPEGWKPIPEKHPTFDLVDLRLADGSVLCGCVPQSDGDYWWEGPSGEVFIDPKYAPATHWRLSVAPEDNP